MKAEYEMMMNRSEMSMIRWMCGIKLNERKRSEELGELIGLEPVSLTIQKSRLKWFGHVEPKYDTDCIRCCTTLEIEGIRQRECPKMIWWDCIKAGMESLGLSQKDAQFRNKCS